MVAPRKIMGQSPWKELMEMLKLQISLGAVDAEEGKIAQQAEFGKSFWRNDRRSYFYVEFYIMAEDENKCWMRMT